MPSQGVFSNEGVLNGDIKVLYQTINGKQHVKALNISNIDKDGDDISISLNELESISLPLSSSGEMTNLEVISITEKVGYYFIDVVDVVLNDIEAAQTNKTVGVTPYLAESFFYNNYNAVLSNAENAETSYLRYDIDRTSGQVKPSNFEAIAGFGRVTFSEMTPGVSEEISYSSGNYFGEKLSPVKILDNDRDLDLLVLEPELINNLGLPQISVNTVPNIAFTRNSSYYIAISSSLILEVDDNANFNNANNHFYSASIADQVYSENSLNYTFSQFKHSIVSGSFTSGQVFLRLKQRNRVITTSNTNEIITSVPFLSSNPSTNNYLNIDLYYTDTQTPYANYAPVQDSNYTSTGFINARYNGTKTGEEDFSGIAPAVAAKPLQAAIYRAEEDNGFICSQSLSDRDLVEVLFEGPTEFPETSSAAIGYLNDNSLTTTSTTLPIQGVKNRRPQPGDIFTIRDSASNDIENIQILTVTATPSNSKFPFYDLVVQRNFDDGLGTGVGTGVNLAGDIGRVLNRLSGARLLTIDKSRLIAVPSKKVWIKENRNIVKTNDRGFVIEISEVCTV